MAHNVSWRSAAPCQELGVDRKWPARCQSDAIDQLKVWRSAIAWHLSLSSSSSTRTKKLKYCRESLSAEE
jgi:hypothetical protein